MELYFNGIFDISTETLLCLAIVIREFKAQHTPKDIGHFLFSTSKHCLMFIYSEIHWIVDQHELSIMRNETINAFQKEFEIFSTYFTHVQQSLMLCPILLTEKIHRIASIISKNYMTPRKPYKINKVCTYWSTPLLRYWCQKYILRIISKYVLSTNLLSTFYML